jgi:hypothetical protein
VGGRQTRNASYVDFTSYSSAFLSKQQTIHKPLGSNVRWTQPAIYGSISTLTASHRAVPFKCWRSSLKRGECVAFRRNRTADGPVWWQDAFNEKRD